VSLLVSDASAGGVHGALRARHELALRYRHSVGGAYAAFLAGLARREIWAVRGADGPVVAPPVDHDPETGVPLRDLVPVSDHGTVASWTWVPEPAPGHPLATPFAFALISLDGADTSLLHVVDVDDEAQMTTGMRVRADWRPNPTMSILDIRAFVPDASDRLDHPGGDRDGPPETPELVVPADLTLAYTFEPGLALSAFFRALGDGRIEGGRCPSCSSVYVPPHPACPACRSGPLEPVALSDRGTVISYTVVHLPFHGMAIELPFVTAHIHLDGADVPFAHLLSEVDPDVIGIGQRVEAVWAPAAERAPTWESIRYFRPIVSTVDESPVPS
jgi:uncharacterized protein